MFSDQHVRPRICRSNLELLNEVWKNPRHGARRGDVILNKALQYNELVAEAEEFDYVLEERCKDLQRTAEELINDNEFDPAAKNVVSQFHASFLPFHQHKRTYKNSTSQTDSRQLESDSVDSVSPDGTASSLSATSNTIPATSSLLRAEVSARVGAGFGVHQQPTYTVQGLAKLLFTKVAASLARTGSASHLQCHTATGTCDSKVATAKDNDADSDGVSGHTNNPSSIEDAIMSWHERSSGVDSVDARNGRNVEDSRRVWIQAENSTISLPLLGERDRLGKFSFEIRSPSAPPCSFSCAVKGNDPDSPRLFLVYLGRNPSTGDCTHGLFPCWFGSALEYLKDVRYETLVWKGFNCPRLAYSYYKECEAFEIFMLLEEPLHPNTCYLLIEGTRPGIYNSKTDLVAKGLRYRGGRVERDEIVVWEEEELADEEM
ncbi:hypothetical protein VNI00_004390 [Paramarasmius palmivorus]|uniref:Uncharacterized protein n=1 Tax=Paramarasmius palmivorus TaxID=297713 RepID=A0AAW0DN50_9AGAR